MRKYLVSENGNINPNFSLLVGLLGVGLIFLVFYINMNLYLSIFIIIIGLLLIAFSGYSTQSATLDLRTFTKDPLGWRKAKQSYKEDKATDEKDRKSDES